mmetsp:Transcript_33857/g.65897  ORF Transcript_33857/g.65897 Transcript_33857/m.65897 type:complete len:426 (-) Transcript_33857:257-1534(-)
MLDDARRVLLLGLAHDQHGASRRALDEGSSCSEVEVPATVLELRVDEVAQEHGVGLRVPAERGDSEELAVAEREHGRQHADGHAQGLAQGLLLLHVDPPEPNTHPSAGGIEALDHILPGVGKSNGSLVPLRVHLHHPQRARLRATNQGVKILRREFFRIRRQGFEVDLERVVHLLALLVRQNRVRLGDAVHEPLALRAVGVLVRVVLHGELAVGRADLTLARGGGDVEQLVVVLGGRAVVAHARGPQEFLVGLEEDQGHEEEDEPDDRIRTATRAIALGARRLLHAAAADLCVQVGVLAVLDGFQGLQLGDERLGVAAGELKEQHDGVEPRRAVAVVLFLGLFPFGFLRFAVVCLLRALLFRLLFRGGIIPPLTLVFIIPLLFLLFSGFGHEPPVFELDVILGQLQALRHLPDHRLQPARPGLLL